MDQSLFALVVKGFGRRALLPSLTGRAVRSAELRFFARARE
jgi:hypothetical protein